MATEEIVKKKRVRNGHRTYVKRSLTDLDNLLEVFDGSQREKIGKIKRILEEKLPVLQNLDEEILGELDEEEEINKEIDESTDIRGSIFEGLEKIEIKFKDFDEERSEQSSEEGGDERSSVSPAASVNQQKQVTTKLPKLYMKKFNGDPKQWQQWWDSFSAAVHDNTVISNIDKFTYLRSLVESTAAYAIAGLQITSANYYTAIDILKERFAQKDLIINSHMECLLSLAKVGSMNEPHKVREIYDKIETNIRGLKALGINSDQYGTLLMPILLSKIPNELKLAISRVVKKDDWNLDNIMNAFKTELEAHERCVNSVVNLTQGANSSNRSQRNMPTTTSALFSNEVKAISCTYCKNAHPSVKCQVMTDINARKELLKRQGRCFACLKRGHMSRECINHIKCFICQKHHHASICNQSKSTRNSNSTSVADSQGGTSLNPAANDTVGTPTTTMYVDGKQTSILLQTGRAYISPVNNPGNTILARILLDSGSQRTYISQKLKSAPLLVEKIL